MNIIFRNQYSRMMCRYNFGVIRMFKMPDLGEKIKEATVKKWHVKVGDQVQEVFLLQNQFDSVADVSTDKMFTQIPSSYSGKIHKIFHQEEDLCQVGEDFLEIEVDAETAEQAPKVQETQAAVISQEISTNQKVFAHNGILATPVVRNLAKTKGIDLSKIKGTGKDGRILKADLEGNNANTRTVEPKAQKNASNSETTIKMSDFQKGMQKSMTEANTIPHLYLKDEFDLTDLAEMREQLKKEKQITYMSLLIKSFSLALLKYPIINSTYDVNHPFQYNQHKSHNISIALDSPKGLVVPNIKNVQDLSISQIQDELSKLRQLGEKGQLGMNELVGGTVCISNIGTIGGTYTGPLILAPQVCIVGVGRMMTVPRYDSKMNLVPKKIINLSFGCDHRVLDGATVARFLNQWKQYLEQPSLMLIHLK